MGRIMSNRPQQQGVVPSFSTSPSTQNVAAMDSTTLGGNRSAEGVSATYQHNTNQWPQMYLNSYPGGQQLHPYQAPQMMSNFAPQSGSATTASSVPGLPSHNYPSTTAASMDNIHAAAYSIPSKWSGSSSGTTRISVDSSRGGESNMGDASISALTTAATTASAAENDESILERESFSGTTGQSHSRGTCESSKSSGPADKMQQSRDRNREHARSTRLRKKAYVQQLKEMAEGLRAGQTEEIRQRRLAVHALTTTQKTRKRIVHQFLKYHADFEEDTIAWGRILEENFWFKQPVTPFRSFRRSEVELVSIQDACRSEVARTTTCFSFSFCFFSKRKDCRIIRGLDAIVSEAASMATMIERIGSRNARWQRIKRKQFERQLERSGVRLEPLSSSQRVESSLSGSSGTDSSDDSLPRAGNLKKVMLSPSVAISNANKVSSSSGNDSKLGRKRKRAEGQKESMTTDEAPTETQQSTSSETESHQARKAPKPSSLPSNIARSGGIVHNISSTAERSVPQTNKSGIHVPPGNMSRPPIKILELKERDVEDIGAFYAINDDDMIVIDDILMCPFVFRTRSAVSCGALADCVMPGMIRANFSKGNKLDSLEMVYDAMGFMQQLDGADGGQVTAQVIPGSLEMALTSAPDEPRVITEARPPYAVVHVNEAWSRLTKYSQVDVEGVGFLGLIERNQTVQSAKTRSGRPKHLLEEVAKGRCACSTNLHYDKLGNIFVDFMCSYPLTK